MARAPFDRTVDLIWGPGWPDAGDVRVAAMPARAVADLVFREELAPMSESLAYITFDQEPAFAPAFVPDGPQQYVWVGTVADQVALVSGEEPTHYVVRVELRTRLPSPSYWRAHIAPIPVPPPDPCPETYHATAYFISPTTLNFVFCDRIGPRTWVKDEWTVTAPVTSAETGCYGTWTLTNGVNTWHTIEPWNGQVQDEFWNEDETTFVSVNMVD